VLTTNAIPLFQLQVTRLTESRRIEILEAAAAKSQGNLQLPFLARCSSGDSKSPSTASTGTPTDDRLASQLEVGATMVDLLLQPIAVDSSTSSSSSSSSSDCSGGNASKATTDGSTHDSSSSSSGASNTYSSTSSNSHHSSSSSKDPFDDWRAIIHVFLELGNLLYELALGTS
jgi:cobalamin biosynthesis Mg chelatase CobN